MTSAAHKLRRAMRISEAQLQSAVIDLATLQGWRVCHFRAARAGDGWAVPLQGHPGFPDVALARAGVVLLVELKSDTGKLTQDQEAWQKAAGSLVWRPQDWTDGTIEAALR